MVEVNFEEVLNLTDTSSIEEAEVKDLFTSQVVKKICSVTGQNIYYVYCIRLITYV